MGVPADPSPPCRDRSLQYLHSKRQRVTRRGVRDCAHEKITSCLARFFLWLSCCTCLLVKDADANTDTRHTRLQVRTEFGSEDEKVLVGVLVSPCVPRWLPPSFDGANRAARVSGWWNKRVATRA